MGTFGTAWSAFWRILKSEQLAVAWRQFAATAVALPTAGADSPGGESPAGDFPVAAVHALALLQREGRLVDFLQENIDGFSDEQVGAAVRQIHAGCRKVLDEHFAIEPIRTEAEGDEITVPADFDPGRIRLTGKVAGVPPFRGSLRHRGWRASQVRLPARLGKTDPALICPAEIEL
jgi:hypothetical protein